MADGAAAPASKDFSPAAPGKRSGGAVGSIGPSSNTGQKGGMGAHGSAEGVATALVDFLTVVFRRSVLDAMGLSDVRNLLCTLFGFRGEVIATPLRERNWNFYPVSALLLDREGENVGGVGLGDETLCVSLSGAGCKWVKSWATVHYELNRLGARISRIDCAHDDYDGSRLNVHRIRELAAQGEFASNGRPPKCRFNSDEGSNAGCTVYVGAKGHKELCVYEKGKQMGLPSSPWTRCEVRLYGKHAEVPLDAVIHPGRYLVGAYEVLGQFIDDECTRIATQKAQAKATGEAMVEWVKTQVGPTLALLRQVFGEDFLPFLESRIERGGTPGRFRGVAKGEPLIDLLRSELVCPQSM